MLAGLIEKFMKYEEKFLPRKVILVPKNKIKQKKLLKWSDSSHVNPENKQKLFIQSSHRMCSIEKGVLKNFAKFTGKHLCQILFFSKVCNYITKEILAQVFSCEFCQIFKNTFFIENLQMTASVYNKVILYQKT